jgi:hypothetical protein
MPVGWAIAVVILAVAVVVLGIIVLGLLRQITPLLERAAVALPDIRPGSQGPKIGEPVPHFSARGPDGEVTDALLRGQPATLLFLSVGCAPCQALAEEMSQSDLDGLGRQLIVVTTADGPRELGIPERVRVLAEQDRAVSRALSVLGTPFAVAVAPDGIVTAASVPNTLQQLTDLTADHG